MASPVDTSMCKVAGRTERAAAKAAAAVSKSILELQREKTREGVCDRNSLRAGIARARGELAAVRKTAIHDGLRRTFDRISTQFRRSLTPPRVGCVGKPAG